MKKSSILFVLCMALLGVLFTSCEKGTESLFKGTWKEVVLTSNEHSKVKEMTLYLDGAGSYTWTIVDNETRIIRGEYRIIDSGNPLVDGIHFSHYEISNMGGLYDLESTPPILYDVRLVDANGNTYTGLKFEKQ